MSSGAKVDIMYCTVMHGTVLYCNASLYCTVLYCTVLYCTVLYYAVYAVLHCSDLKSLLLFDMIG